MDWPAQRLESWGHFTAVVSNISSPDEPFRPAYLFRGHADAGWRLCPLLVRLLGPGVTAEEAIDVERRILEVFHAQSHLFLDPSSLPPVDDLPGWWALMQHHGAPTRLLDWTASAYVAAYFAVEGLWQTDGAICLVHPGSVASAYNSIPRAAPRPMHEVLVDPDAYDSVLALPPTKQSARMAAQQGHFTMCTNILGDQQELLLRACQPKAGDSGPQCARFIVPKESKPEYLYRLRAMNVTATALFPGIDGLGRSLAEITRLHSHTRPNRTT
jgi:hypothetical protein